MTRRGAVSASLVCAAIAAAVIPISPAWVERWYSTGMYPRVQAILTPATNLVPVALLDIASAVLLAAFAGVLARRVRARGVARGAAGALIALVVAAAAAYLLFLAVWGLNYRRVPMEQKLAYDEARITTEAARALAARAIEAMNANHAAAHGTTFDAAALASAFGDAERALGGPGATVPGVPKRSVLAWYFRRAAVDGMTDPFFLEVIVNPDVLQYERPFVVAHEWAHLAGFADESEANFVAFVACVRGDPLARYSGWLAAYQHLVAGLPRSERRRLPAVDPGPRADLRAIAQRYERSSARVRRASRVVYDRYLRINRVDEGIASYSAVVRLMLGATFDASWAPRLR